MKKFAKFIGVSNHELIGRINNSPDFMYDDEAAELESRGAIWSFVDDRATLQGTKLFN